MKVLFLVFFVELVLSDPIPYNGYNYHEDVGIIEAAKIKAAEEANGVDPRIIGGSNVALGQYPYMAGILITLRTGFQSVCGGSVLTNTKVITAAHCWWDGRNQARQFMVILGSLNVFSGGTRKPTSNVIMHPGWDASIQSYDVAVVTLPWTSFTDNIQAIALPSGSLLNSNLIGSTVETVGYGVRSDDSSITSSQPLQSVNLTVVDTTICRNLYGQGVQYDTICVWGEDGRSTCDGDTGGPLVLRTDQPVLVGIGAFHHRQSCQLGYPVGFTSVSSHLPWIELQIVW